MRDLESGLLVSGFRLERQLDRGPASTVYSAVQEPLGRRVAVKFFEPGDEAATERLIRGAALYSTIQHPNVLPIYQVGEWEGRPFVAMRFVPTNLAELIARTGPLTEERVAAIVEQAASALAALHERGIVYGTVTPSSLLLDSTDHVYLAEPAVAPLARATVLGSAAPPPHGIEFLAPEEIRGEPPTPRTDIYELGAVTYAALTGHPPYERASELASLQAHLSEPPPSVVELRPEVESAWDEVIARAMAKDPGGRFGSAAELARAISQSLIPRDMRKELPAEAADLLVGEEPETADVADEGTERQEAARQQAEQRVAARQQAEQRVAAQPQEAEQLEDEAAEQRLAAQQLEAYRVAAEAAEQRLAAQRREAYRVAPEAAEQRLAAQQRQPPRSAYARLDGPGYVVSGESFEIVVGLSPKAVEGVVGEKLRVPDSVVGPYTLTVQVVADGFSLAADGDWRLAMPVTAQAPYPAVPLRLIAEEQEEPARARTLQAVYSIGGQTIGLAFRPIAVLRDTAEAPPALKPSVDPGFDVVLPEGWLPPDLTVHILHGKEEQAGRLLWTFETPHAEVEVPREEIPCDIGEEPEAFAARLVKKMPSYEGQPDLYDYVAGIGTTVADNVPARFWSLLAEVAARSDGDAPSVMFLSAEPHVPWELAVMEEPLRANVAPFVSAQARVGRWVLGHRRPKLPPPMFADARSLAVVYGKYDKPGWKRLVEAEAEASDLQTKYAARPVKADTPSVLKCIKGDPPADVLHFSVHGKYDPTGVQDGLVLVDGRTLDPMVVRGNRFESPRFVFLNACQVGMGDQVLGDYAGMAAAFLYAGAAGVVAPLWSIDDALARELALDFYEAAFAGTAPADLLRRKRESFRADLSPASSTYIAYQFFGHPDMQLVRA